MKNHIKLFLLFIAVSLMNLDLHAQSWNLAGNSGTTPASQFLGTTDAVSLRIRTNNQVRMQITSGGKLGFGTGTATPAGWFHIKGKNNEPQLVIDAAASQTAANPFIMFRNNLGSELIRIHSDNFTNFFAGNYAGYYNDAAGGGLNNVFIGHGSGFTNSIGSGNTAVGRNTLFLNVDGSINTAIGAFALSNNVSGGSNTAVGFSAMGGNIDGLANTAIGHAAMEFNISGISNTVVGYDAFRHSTTGNYNSTLGRYSLATASGSSNVAVGFSAGDPVISGIEFNQCTFIGANSSPTVNRTNVAMLGYGIANAQCTNSNQVLIGNTAITQVRSNVQAFTAYSDGRYKTNIKNDIKGLDFITRLNPVSYNVRPKELHKIWGTPDSLVEKIDHSEVEQVRYSGLIAQEVEKAMHESGYEFTGIDIPRNEHEAYTMRYTELIMPMIQAIKEQQKMIDGLKKVNNEMQIRLQAIEKKEKRFSDKVQDFRISSISPNPSNEQIYIELDFQKSYSSASLVFMDENSKTVKTVLLGASENSGLGISVGALASGTYYVSLMVDGKFTDVKSIVINK